MSAGGCSMLTPAVWGHPPAMLSLGSREVHVWRAHLPEHTTHLAALSSLLSPDERTSAARFRFASDRERYTLSRGLLRVILSRYLAVAPERLEFSYGPQGKPAILVPADGGWLRFNLSHARDLALYALCRDHELGIDVEYMRSDIEYERIARHVFSLYERTILSSLPPHERAEAFFRCWTMKESYVKARGGGLSIPLDQFDVALAPGASPAILATRPDATQASRWTLARLDPGAGYTMALAMEGSIEALTCWQVEPSPLIWDSPAPQSPS